MLQAEQILQGRYQLSQKLSNNPSRQTWLAFDLAAEPKQPVIVKLLPFSPQTQWDDLKLFEREAQVLKHLNHPQIPRYRDYFSVDKETGGGLPWFGLVQDYIKGLSLQQLFNSRQRFSEAEAKEIATQLLNILIYLHELSPPVLHRDIKPSNIIWAENEQVYLVDFGAVQEKAKAEKVTFTVVGTGGYAPPEQLWGRAVSASDLYALGATLIHLLTGTSPANLPQQRMRLQFQDKVTLTPSFAHWIEKLTDPAPERRFSQARQALMALQAASHKSEGTVQKARYGRIGGLALLQSAAVLVFAVAVPNFMVYRGGCKSCQGKSGLGIINRAQQSYFLKHQKFADSVQTLAIGMKNPTENYEYSTHATPLAVFNYATSRNKEVTSYVGGVFLESGNEGKDELVTIAIACEPIVLEEQSDLTEPIVQGNVLECGSNTQYLNRTTDNPTGRIMLGKDSALAYNSVNYAVTGQYNQALVVAQAIDSSPLKEKALKAITRANTHQRVQSTPSLSQALEVAKTIPDDDIKAWVLTDIAQQYAVAGQQSQAMEILSQALEIANTLKEADTKAMIWADISQQYAVAEPKSQAVGILSQRAEETEGDR
ncbi:serine/threonine protein kinase [Allocoleopsis franciscana PCC 7113]|uniref:Serine/threonine protein kinase n=2 Tax=Allocoleopsis TaxID=2886347 RepID=K9WKD5_9CYAN|nr:type IV pilin-like G/H family protein [Allocoleopsis franciscana]AFZ20234.1 serine/threonine protein kinase [Allocoleopsis franciscana PCC 7113]